MSEPFEAQGRLKLCPPKTQSWISTGRRKSRIWILRILVTSPSRGPERVVPELSRFVALRERGRTRMTSWSERMGFTRGEYS
jgi:hypothetical protein